MSRSTEREKRLVLSLTLLLIIVSLPSCMSNVESSESVSTITDMSAEPEIEKTVSV